MGEALAEMRLSCAVTFSGSEYGLPLESVSWTRMCVGELSRHTNPRCKRAGS